MVHQYDAPESVAPAPAARGVLRVLAPGETCQANTVSHRRPEAEAWGGSRVRVRTYVRSPGALPSPVRLSIFSVEAAIGPIPVPASAQGTSGCFEFTLPDSAGIVTLFNPPDNPAVEVGLQCCEELLPEG